jgi:hypothetical protein
LFEGCFRLFDLQFGVALIDRRDDLALGDKTAEIDVDLRELARRLRRDDDLFVGSEGADHLYVPL